MKKENKYIIREGKHYTEVTVNDKGIIIHSTKILSVVGKNIELYPIKIPVIQNYIIHEGEK